MGLHGMETLAVQNALAPAARAVAQAFRKETTAKASPFKSKERSPALPDVPMPSYLEWKGCKDLLDISLRIVNGTQNVKAAETTYTKIAEHLNTHRKLDLPIQTNPPCVEKSPINPAHYLLLLIRAAQEGRLDEARRLFPEAMDQARYMLSREGLTETFPALSKEELKKIKNWMHRKSYLKSWGKGRDLTIAHYQPIREWLENRIPLLNQR